MFFGLGVADDGYALSLHKNAYFLVHEQKRWRGEQYSVDSLGYSLKLPFHRMVSFTSHFKLGYEHHYKSEHYARSYVASSAGFGVETRHDLVRFAFSVEPGKYFYKLSSESDFKKHSLRVAPAAVVSVMISITDGIVVPRNLLKENKDEKTSRSRDHRSSNSRRKLRPAGANPTQGRD